MRRSFINQCIEQALTLCDRQQFHLPVWARWSPRDWLRAAGEIQEIRRCRLGWDVTDFGSARFDQVGLLLFTLRNGAPGDVSEQAKSYCEKLLLIGPGQVTPTHFHWSKMEDIINRGGGRLVLELWQADRAGEQPLDRQDVRVSVDGLWRTVAPGERVVLEPGQSITLPPYLYHRFYADPAGPTVLAGEVSKVNDDQHDNRFLDRLPRFATIQEDEPARYLLCHEYPPQGP